MRRSGPGGAAPAVARAGGAGAGATPHSVSGLSISTTTSEAETSHTTPVATPQRAGRAPHADGCTEIET